MRLDMTVAMAGDTATDVLVETDEAATVADVAHQIARAVGQQQVQGLWFQGARLDEGARIPDTALVQGGVVALDTATAAPSVVAPQSGWQLHVVSGPDAGTIISLPVGRHELGRQGRHCFADQAMSRRHAVLQVNADGVTIADLGSANGTTVEGQDVPAEEDDRLPVELGQVIGIGDDLLTIRAAAAADAPVHTGAEGTIELTRPPRLRPPGDRRKIVMPRAPEKRRNRRIPLIAVFAPLVLGVAMATIEKQPAFLLFALASPAMAIGNVVSDRRGSAKDYRTAQATYRERFAAANQSLAEALARETEQRRVEYPDPAAALLVATLPGRRIWERRRTDRDALDLRLGSADLPSRVEVDVPGDEVEGVQSGPRTLYSIPATLPLRDCGVVGLAGPPEVVDALARWMVVQLAVWHPPKDLSLTLLTNRKRATWSWFRWLPHATPADPDAAVASVGNDADTVAARVAELSSLVKNRRAALPPGRADRSLFPAHVAVIDDARSMRAVQGLAQVLQDGPDVGVFAICLGEEDRLLPEECSAVVTVEQGMPAHVDARRTGEADVTAILADQVNESYAEAVARSLAPLRTTVNEDGEVPLPDSARLLDILGVEPPTVDAIRARWLLEGRSTAMPIGIGGAGTFTLDLRRDGPHGLVAGTTGAGKSELLQSMIASLAVANRPESLNFVLVDYKGGSAFKDCVHLPHTVGMVTDLDAHLVERAIVSLSAELKRREHVLARAGTKDLEDYDALADQSPDLEPMPRLVIVIDEFASMARELPDFVTGLVNVAQRGRSLGIHLMLATQRPSGVVSSEIRANTNLRIALRVTDAGDSTDVIDAPDSSRIAKSTPGRAFARLGHGALEPFQAGRIGGRRPGAAPETIPPPFVATVGWTQLGYPPPQPDTTSNPDEGVATDLSELVAVIRQAAEASGSARQRSPWLEPLPDKLLLDDLEPATGPAELAPIPYGREDIPAAQRQQSAAFDLAGGHLLAIGSSRSGRSQLLRTIAGSAARLHSPDDVHLYGLDCGNGALLALRDLPHCGAVVSRSQTERATRLLNRLTSEMDRRQSILASGGFADISEQRRANAPTDRLPHLLLMLDRWEGFTSALGEIDGGRLTDQVLSVLREGGSVGVNAIFTGDRTLASGRIGSLCDNKLALRLAERADYSYVGLSPRQLPDRIPAGRGFNTDTATEVQVALLDAADSGQAQAAALAKIAAAAAQPRWHRPFRVDDLPLRISYEEAVALDGGAAGVLVPLVAVGGDELSARGPDLALTPTFVVAGPQRSGRTNALWVIARSLTERGAEVLLVAPRDCHLRRLGGQAGVRGLLTDPSAGRDVWTEQLGIRKRPLVVVIDDGETLRDSPAGDLLREVMRGGSPLASALVLGGAADGICTGLSGWQVEAKRARQGLLLSPQTSTDGDLIGIRLARSAFGGPVQAGRGLIHLGDGKPLAVTVPLADG